MPHIIIEYTPDTKASPTALVKAAHEAAAGTGIFNVNDIKTRTLAVQHYQVGTGSGGFVHVIAYILEGRTMEQKKTLTHAIGDALTAFMASGQALTVDVRDLVKESYCKKIL